jgi:hypothetical protein
VPRISIDLLEFAGAAQIHLNPSAPGAGGEEKVLGRLIRLGGDFPVVELFEATAVGVGFTGYNRKLGCRSGVIPGGQWDVREGEAWGFLSLGVIADGRLDAGERYPCEEQKSRNYGSQPNVIYFWQWRCKRNHGFIFLYYNITGENTTEIGSLIGESSRVNNPARIADRLPVRTGAIGSHSHLIERNAFFNMIHSLVDVATWLRVRQHSVISLIL